MGPQSLMDVSPACRAARHQLYHHWLWAVLLQVVWTPQLYSVSTKVVSTPQLYCHHQGCLNTTTVLLIPLSEHHNCALSLPHLSEPNSSLSLPRLSEHNKFTLLFYLKLSEHTTTVTNSILTSKHCLPGKTALMCSVVSSFITGTSGTHVGQSDKNLHIRTRGYHSRRMVYEAWCCI